MATTLELVTTAPATVAKPDAIAQAEKLQADYKAKRQAWTAQFNYDATE